MSGDRHQDTILGLLEHSARMGKELAGDIGVTTGRISQIMIEMCRSGLVQKGFSLTEEGRRRLEAIRP